MDPPRAAEGLDAVSESSESRPAAWIGATHTMVIDPQLEATIMLLDCEDDACRLGRIGKSFGGDAG